MNDGGVWGTARGLLAALRGGPLFLGYFWMLWDAGSQTWHDKLAGTVVVPVDAYPVSGGWLN